MDHDGKADPYVEVKTPSVKETSKACFKMMPNTLQYFEQFTVRSFHPSLTFVAYLKPTHRVKSCEVLPLGQALALVANQTLVKVTGSDECPCQYSFTP